MYQDKGGEYEIDGRNEKTSAYPSKELCQYLRKKGMDIDINTELKITGAFNSITAGEVVCPIMVKMDEIKESDKAFLVSLTLLRIKSDHPLSNKIWAYQKQRIKRISR